MYTHRYLGVMALLALSACAKTPAPPAAEQAKAQEPMPQESTSDEPGAPGHTPYANMPKIAPIGVRIGKYMDVPASAQGPAVDPAKGYRLQDLGNGL